MQLDQPHLKTHDRRIPHVWTALMTGVCAVAAFPIAGYAIPVWLQPALVGLIWGTLFLLGFWYGSSRPRTAFPLVALIAIVLWLTLSMRSVMDFTLRESLLFSVLLFACGWGVIRLDRKAFHLHWHEPRELSQRQFSLLDIFLMTTLVACSASCLMGWTTPLPLLFGVGATLVVGCCCNWAAYRWAWDDPRPVGRPLAAAGLCAVMGIYTAIRFSPSLGAKEIAEWLLCGPASVIAAQAFVVLLAFAFARRSFFKIETT